MTYPLARMSPPIEQRIAIRPQAVARPGVWQTVRRQVYGIFQQEKVYRPWINRLKSTHGHHLLWPRLWIACRTPSIGQAMIPA